MGVNEVNHVYSEGKNCILDPLSIEPGRRCFKPCPPKVGEFVKAK
jgi:hypothetical protein